MQQKRRRFISDRPVLTVLTGEINQESPSLLYQTKKDSLAVISTLDLNKGAL